MVEEDVSLEFIPCDVHKDTPAVNMEIREDGRVKFKCGCCRTQQRTNCRG